MNLQRIPFAGSVRALAAIPEGDIFLQVAANAGGEDDLLASYDINGTLRWQQHVTASPLHALKIVGDHLWLNQLRKLGRYDLDGKLLKDISINLQHDEIIGDYLIADGSIYLNTGAERMMRRDPRVIRIDETGKQLWTTTLPKTLVAYKGLVETSSATGWQITPKKPMQPRDWRPTRNLPIALSGDRLLVSYFDYSSGLSLSYCLDTSTGELLWTTPSIPSGSKMPLPAGRFLIGAQGYGVFESTLYERDGSISGSWESHGYSVIDEYGHICVVEMENTTPSRMHFVVLERNGVVRRGAHLENYDTSYPVMDRDGNTWFFREGELIKVDAQLEKQIVTSETLEHPYRTWTTRILLVKGKLVFCINIFDGQITTNSELRLYEGLASDLAGSPWACEFGDLGANPVI